jgi:hypothetical protein
MKGGEIHQIFSFLLTFMKGGEVQWTFSFPRLTPMKGGKDIPCLPPFLALMSRRPFFSPLLS